MKTLTIALICATCLCACKKSSTENSPKSVNVSINVTGIADRNTYSVKATNQETHTLIEGKIYTRDTTFQFKSNPGDVIEIDWEFSNNIDRTGLGKITISNDGVQVFSIANHSGVGSGDSYMDYIK